MDVQVYGHQSKQTSVCLFNGNEGTCQPTVWHAVFNHFSTTLELYEIKERDVFGCDTHKILVSRIHSSVDSKKKE